MPITRAIIPAAGLGTRLLPLSAAVAKELLPLGPKPVLQWIGEELAASGINRFTLVASPNKPDLDRVFRRDKALIERLRASSQLELVARLWSEGRYGDCDIQVTIQQQQMGLGHAILCGRDQIGNHPFVVALGDCVFGPPAESNITKKLLDVFAIENADAVIAFETVPLAKVHRYGIAKPADDRAVFRLDDLIEKPAPADAPSTLAVAARYAFSVEIFEYLGRIEPGIGGEWQLTDAIRLMIGDKRKVLGVRLPATVQRFDLGDYGSYVQAFAQFAAWYPPESICPPDSKLTP